MSALTELQNFTFTSKYARYIPELKRRETWKEAVERVKQMMLDQYKEQIEVHDDIEWAYDLMLKKRVLGSQRALQFGGPAVFKHHARSYNCCGSYIDRLRFFQECMYLLLCGTGTGFSVQKHHIDKLPKLLKKKEGTVSHTIEDSIEGWSDAVGILVSSYFKQSELFQEYNSKEIEFKFHRIRQKGSNLSSSSGKAPGPEPLKKALIKIKSVLDKCLINQEFKSIDAYDIVMHSSDAVISGGVRRSATICLFSADDQDMLTAKTGDWYKENPQRGRSNNSVVLLKDKLKFEEFDNIIQHTKEFGEPGFYLTENLEQVSNPCMPETVNLLTPNGIKQLKDINIGDEIWSETGWTKVIKKWKTGVKSVFRYKTTFGSIDLTDNHKVVSNKKKIEIKNTQNIDILRGFEQSKIRFNNQDIMDGLVLGDGTIHKASNNLILLCIGKNDKDYFNSEISKFIVKDRPGIRDNHYEIITTITSNELSLTYKRIIPDRFVFGNQSKILGFLRGLYSANGSICSNRITLKSTSFQLIKQVQLMLSSVGIASYYTTNKPQKVKFDNGEYICKESYDLNITRDLNKFYNKIGFIQKYKTQKLIKIYQNQNNKSKKEQISKFILGQEYLGEQEVFDITVDNNTHTFWCEGFNISNCVEISFYCYDESGRSGWQMCNLSTINCSKIKSKEDFLEAAKAAAIIGTLQAGFTKFAYLGEASEKITSKEALLGVSMTGIMDKHEICLNPEYQKEAANLIKETNKIIAAKIGINQAARTTCVKPEGTTSCLLGTSSGIHPHHAKRYIRRVQANKSEHVYQYFKLFNQHATEHSVWSANNTDEVISFPIEVEDGAKLKNQISALELLEIVKNTQINWVHTGKNKSLCSQPWIQNNVSNTITVKSDEWEEVAKYIYDNRKYFCGISLLPASGDKDYQQAPFTTVHNAYEIIKQYGEGSLWCSGLIELCLQSFNNLWLACDAIMDDDFKLTLNINKTKKELKQAAKQIDCWDRSRKFAIKYFNNDLKQLCYCLKDVYLWKDYCDLIKNFQRVDYSFMIEEEDNTKFEELSACAGGKCDLV